MKDFHAYARATLMLAEYANLHGLPEPFVITLCNYPHSTGVEMILKSRAEVDAWVDGINVEPVGGDHYRFAGDIYDIPVVIVTTEPAAVAS